MKLIGTPATAPPGLAGTAAGWPGVARGPLPILTEEAAPLDQIQMFPSPFCQVTAGFFLLSGEMGVFRFSLLLSPALFLPDSYHTGYPTAARVQAPDRIDGVPGFGASCL